VDILGKAVNRPIYKILGGTKDKVLAYASSQHLANVEDFAASALKAKAAGFKAYKIHPGGGQRRTGAPIPAYLGHIEEIKEVRKAMGDDFTLLFDPVQRYNYFEALKVGRVLDECGYVSFEDPIPTTEIEGLIELRRNLDVPIEVGEFILDIYQYGEYIRRGAMDVGRLIVDNLCGITGSFRVGQLIETFGMPCTPTTGAPRLTSRRRSRSSWRCPTVSGSRCPGRWNTSTGRTSGTRSGSMRTAMFRRPQIRAWDTRSTVTQWTSCLSGSIVEPNARSR